jgi:hypothetical protein
MTSGQIRDNDESRQSRKKCDRANRVCGLSAQQLLLV